ncbi:hypothetical protein [Pedobacter rhodius]|uniref:Uncharacterized protein n=1 Tax=Pedobacter rhodius TaxID=3004098 RepID=A0ABT4KX44_9SPHI|nr:hypothetical protein [Pedobacter sp. SJ11]MCZ4223500.1 hypothetical protein [Pedobacter sp. SJ11]
MGKVDFNKKFEDKTLKGGFWAVIVVVLVIIILLSIVTTIKIYNGDHVKLFGLEYNIPKPQLDTTIKDIPTSKDVPSVKDKPNPKMASSTNFHSREKIKPSVKYNITAPVTNSAIGDNAVTNNYNGVKQRHLDEETYKSIMRQIDELYIKYPDYDTTKIDVVIHQDEESGILGDELVRNLKLNGFQVITHPSISSNFTNNFTILKGWSNYPLIWVEKAKNGNH